jgi:hypothetical protein
VATEYVVLAAAHSDEPGKGWIEVGRVTAANDVAAIRVVASADDALDLSSGAVAVPARNWRPRKPERRVEERTLWT